MKWRLLISLSACVAASATPEPVTLSDTIDRALIVAPALERAEAQVAAAKAGVDLAASQKRPKLGLRGEVGVLETDFTADRISQVPRSVGLQGDWTVYTSGAYEASQNASESSLGAARSLLMGARDRTVLEALESYSLAWLAQETVLVAEERAETFRVRFEETAARFEQGELTRTDTALTEARLASAQAQLQASRAGLAAAQARLARVSGLDAPQPVVRPAIGPLSLASQSSALERVLARNPNLAAAELAAKSAASRLDEVKGQFGPKVSLRARATHGEDVFFFFEDPISDVGAFVTVDVPLITSGQRSAAQRQARSNKVAIESDVKLARLELKEAVASLWFNVEARRAALLAAQRAEKAAQLAAQGTKREFDAGIRTLVDSLDAETGYQDARVATSRAEVELLLAKAQLLSLSSDLEPAIISTN